MGTVFSLEHSERIRTLFRELVSLAPEQRALRLAHLRANDSSVGSEVETLLAAHERADEVLQSLDRQLPGLPSSPAEEQDPLLCGCIAHYQILERLGGGGMGVVYKARDLKLDRTVALKFLPPHLSLDEEAKARFIHEAKAASALDHPNICTIYEIGETGEGRLFIAMAYYEGETLKPKIARGPLPVEEAVAYAIQIAEGLTAAHEAGIVHRDVKPANVLVTTKGVAKVADFGIAKVAGQELTRPGRALGTGGYMSPEQLRGEGVDHRTDLWSLGVVLYEMLSGERPFRAEHEQAVFYAIERREPEALRRMHPEVPEELARVVERLLRKDPAERYQTAEELLSDLRALRELPALRVRRPERAPRGARRRRMWGSAAAVVLVLSLLGMLLSRQASSPEEVSAAASSEMQPRLVSLAVLPLKNYSGDPAQEFFADGMTEELITTLSKIEGLRVVAHQSVLQFKQSQQPVPEIARLLDVDHLIGGSVLQEGDRVRITVNLIDAARNAPVWGERFERERRDVLVLQREVALAIARQIELTLTPQDRARLAAAPQVDPEAFELYVRGTQARYQLTRGFSEAMGYFEQAIARDSSYAPAYAAIAWIHAYLGNRAGARRFVQKALELDPSLAETYVALGLMREHVEWDWTGAEEAFRQAIRLNPGYAEAHHELSMLLMRLRRFDEAVREAQYTLYLAPMSARFQSGLGEVYLYAGRYDEAVAALEKAIPLDPNFRPHIWLALAYGGQQRYDLAMEEVAKAPSRHLTGCLYARAYLGYLHAVTGQPAAAREVLNALTEEWRKGDRGITSCAYSMAVVHAGLGEHGRALELLEQHASPDHLWWGYLAIEPTFRPLHAEPRFQALLGKVGLE